MADKIQKTDDKTTNQADPNLETAELEHHVDEMMDPGLPDPKPQTLNLVGTPSGAPDLPEIDIFQDAPTTPVVAKDTPPEHIDIPKSEEKIPIDPSVDEAAADPLVDDIVARESDALLAVQDAEVAKAFGAEPGHTAGGGGLGAFFGKWRGNKLARYSTLLLVLLGVAAAGVVPDSRYFVLNSVGVRVGATVTVLDSTTDLPLKNVAVTLGDKSDVTNQDGVVRLKDLTLGEHQLTVQQLGFAKVTRTVTLGLGSNPLEDTELKATGAQYTFTVTDYLSSKPVTNAEVTSGDSSAQSDDKGVVVLTVGKIESSSLEATITAGGYRSEQVTINTLKSDATNVPMVMKRKEVFVSKQSGTYDVYKVDIDGKNRQLLLAGTGKERDQITLVPHPTDELVALVSSREDKRNPDGYLLDTLTVINVETGATVSLEHAERIKIVDWVKDRLIYVKVKAGVSAGNPDRNQLMSYNTTTTDRLQLAAANDFTDIVSAKGALYYAAANDYVEGQSTVAKVNPDNTGKQTLLNDEIWDIIRSDYDDFYLIGSNTWYRHNIGDDAPKKLDTYPSDQAETRFYLDAPSGSTALWTDTRDGKGVLLTYDTVAQKDKILTSQTGLTFPVRWLDSRTVSYRIITPGESAAYVVSLDGGMPKKVSDVTNTTGLGRWFRSY